MSHRDTAISVGKETKEDNRRNRWTIWKDMEAKKMTVQQAMVLVWDRNKWKHQVAASSSLKWWKRAEERILPRHPWPPRDGSTLRLETAGVSCVTCVLWSGRAMRDHRVAHKAITSSRCGWWWLLMSWVSFYGCWRCPGQYLSSPIGSLVWRPLVGVILAQSSATLIRRSYQRYECTIVSRNVGFLRPRREEWNVAAKILFSTWMIWRLVEIVQRLAKSSSVLVLGPGYCLFYKIFEHLIKINYFTTFFVMQNISSSDIK